MTRKKFSKVNIEISNICNLQCSFCPPVQRSKKMMSLELFEKIIATFSDYFNTSPSQFYFDDMSSKNVLIHLGKFNGLVDLDGVSYGDYLEWIGRIKGSWYGTDYGNYYAHAVMDNLDLNEQQRKIVCMWAILNKIQWQSEIWVQFNQNTSPIIDAERVEKGNKTIEALMQELSI